MIKSPMDYAAENERLTAQVESERSRAVYLSRRAGEAEADNDRLRTVLQQIVERYETAEDGWPAEDMRAMARRALEHKP